MNKENSEALILFAYDMQQNNHEKYLGALQIMRKLAKTDRVLNKMMKSEGLIYA